MKGDFLIKKYKFGIAKNKRHGTIELRTMKHLEGDVFVWFATEYK